MKIGNPFGAVDFQERPLKRFVLFAWAEWEAHGGFRDVRASFDTLEEAQKFELPTPYLDSLILYDRVENLQYPIIR